MRYTIWLFGLFALVLIIYVGRETVRRAVDTTARPSVEEKVNTWLTEEMVLQYLDHETLLLAADVTPDAKKTQHEVKREQVRNVQIGGGEPCRVSFDIISDDASYAVWGAMCMHSSDGAHWLGTYGSWVAYKK
jgi:hypothetical protein